MPDESGRSVSPQLAVVWLARLRRIRRMLQEEPHAQQAWLWRLRLAILQYLTDRYDVAHAGDPQDISDPPASDLRRTIPKYARAYVEWLAHAHQGPDAFHQPVPPDQGGLDVSHPARWLHLDREAPQALLDEERKLIEGESQTITALVRRLDLLDRTDKPLNEYEIMAILSAQRAAQDELPKHIQTLPESGDV